MTLERIGSFLHRVHAVTKASASTRYAPFPPSRTSNPTSIQEPEMPSLFDPIQLGDLHLPNRIFMAPLTRLRGTPDHIPTPIMVDYYTQRASAGLIISEGTPIDPLAVGYANVPGLWSQQQTEAWKPIPAAVHNAGGHISSQIWHVGRISDPELLNGQLPIAPSAIA